MGAAVYPEVQMITSPDFLMGAGNLELSEREEEKNIWEVNVGF